MRVTEGMRYGEVLRNLTRIEGEHAEASRQAMTGVRVDRPSKDPVAAAELARLRASLSSNAGHKATIQLVRGDAELAESTLAQAGDLLTRAREIALLGANGAMSGDERAVMALEVQGIKDELVRLGNTRGTKGYIFSGSQINTEAFSAAGAFQGDDASQSVDIGGKSPVQVGASGARAFTAAGGRDVFQMLETLNAALSSNDSAAVSATLDGLAGSHEQITAERSRVGLVVGRLETSHAVLEQLELDSARRQEDVGAADPVEAYSRVSSLGASLERSVAVSKQIFELTGINRF